MILNIPSFRLSIPSAILVCQGKRTTMNVKVLRSSCSSPQRDFCADERPPGSREKDCRRALEWRNWRNALQNNLNLLLSYLFGRASHRMLLEDQRFIHEDLERLEQAIADRLVEEPRNVSCTQFLSLSPLLTTAIFRFGNACLGIMR